MKSFYIFLFSILPVFVFGQITILSTDMAQIGDVVMRNADTLTTLTEGSAGANQQWVMTTATIHLMDTTKIIAPSSTPHAASYPTSNIAMTNDNLSFLYFIQNSDSQATTGAAGDLFNNGQILVTPFNPNLLLNRFPRNFGDNFQDTYGIDVTIDGTAFGVSQVRYKRISTVYDTTDGYGKLTTPIGTYDVLRAKHVEHYKDTIWVKALPFTPFTVFQTNDKIVPSFSWLAKETKLAVAELSYDEDTGLPKKYTWSLIAPTVGIDDKMQDLSVKAYPSFTKDNLYFDLPEAGDYQVEIMDMQGKTMASERFSETHYTSVLSEISNGNYIWKITEKTNGKTASGQFVKE